MPRTARKKSASGFYHIILRGSGKQIIFEEDDDKLYFLILLKRYGEETGFMLYAYCLMENHVHLLLSDSNNEIATIMKKITCAYAAFFNLKYERTGHLFQDRYRSEAIASDRYFLAVLRYIHQNPQRAGFAETDNYKWSSHREYISHDEFVSTELALELLGGRENYLSFVCSDTHIKHLHLDTPDKCRYNDTRAVELIKQETAIDNIQQLRIMDKKDRDKVLLRLKERGLSVRQISRLTGIGKNVILKAQK